MSENALIEGLSVWYDENIEDIQAVCTDGFLNNGYWKNVDLTGQISSEGRSRSEKDLYRNLLDALEIDSEDSVIEIGCGHGRGAATVFREYAPSELRAIDVLPVQIGRAQEKNEQLIAQSNGKLSYVVGSAINIPYSDNSFTKVYSVEAVQHVLELDRFAAEISRVSRRPARVGITAAFAPSEEVTVEDWFGPQGMDTGPCYAHTTKALVDALAQAGFTNFIEESIGEHVFYGFDVWLKQTGYNATGQHNWLDLYNDGLVDYRLIVADLR